MNIVTAAIAGVLALIILLNLFIIFFNRNPKRKINRGNHLLAPADGKILNILSLNSNAKLKIHKKYLGKINTLTSDVLGKKKGYMISIFMNPMNVHVNRYPIDGKVVSTKHTPGKLLPVNKFWNAFQNEKNETILETPGKTRIKVIQIAGLLAKKIVCKAKPGSIAKQGAIFGRIKLGSQVAVIFPEQIAGYKAKINIKKGDKVKAGINILAKLE